MIEKTENRRKLVLHIGAHKTGSSAIQSFLHMHRADLNAKRWIFCTPPTGLPNWGPMFGVDPKASSPKFRLLPEVFAQLLARIDRRARDVILSVEDLFFLDSPDVAVFAAALKRRFPEITIICYLRRQDQMAMSHWAQGGRTAQSALIFGSKDNPLPELTPHVRNYLNYAKRLTMWQTALPKANCLWRCYNRDTFPNRDVVADFLAATGIELDAGTAVTVANEALGASSVRLVYLLREAGVPQPQIHRMLRSGLIPATDDKVWPSRAAAMAFVQAFTASNAKLAEMAGRESFFSNDYDSHPEQSHIPPMDPEFVIPSLLRLLTNALKQIPVKPGPAAAEPQVSAEPQASPEIQPSPEISSGPAPDPIP